ncbi:MAG: 4'-phosphopantetheinyl transferase superfamily protein [Lachnospiraceae bacterium]|nr:4'-phosphopantetheinyl transferase superfamily protein [Lachnospiraceae bacterium]
MEKRFTGFYAASVADLETEYVYQRAYRLLPEERQLRVERYRFLKDKRLSLGAFLLLLWGLGEWGISSEDLEICYHENGKPYLGNRNGVFFNLSHSGEYVICAVSEKEVGCDVEKISEYREGVAKRFFSSSEYEMLLDLKTEQEKAEIFFRLWTLKESYIKAIGKGLSMPLDSFSFSFEAPMVQEFAGEKYYFREFDIHTEYKCALCGKDSNIGDEKGVNLKILSLSNVIEALEA